MLFCKFDFAYYGFKWELCTLPSELLFLDYRHVYICNSLCVGLGGHISVALPVSDLEAISVALFVSDLEAISVALFVSDSGLLYLV